ncbi:tRNA (cytosine(32)/uridine(32)-2'-O)-methyltransferase TrmJ [Ursidibacter maritimus]|uniref:tRNA (cytidine/uridine-2'-O-)-methyltransferase TrmJ n=1 Tax=Ursidibacter maritimus TaxID=1331689 RepID=A0A949SYB9_9PAST|nr:tRNA (cytosine(32)/uridine(32)-2'-O)-methyltransferase TrmJ [Ursidibacter maritimus]KAE9541444.1 tRNA (cytosine(32)/uridine(32)-2'-O)-methyltransferase TrmJ [Ursidibacter maritimus]MBV6523855.1 tRNA (cytosine(32)/uridine(32)-2'-O)-methyltransferase TrmJ [Ursidibacter maritimus]MBV6526130.1 tRNA (cytosine(32)/uridine(32)-2'-O)-methyltransferase TrmJ [Ursidibacter maritimus]MBV6527170.1 tRNA (cytosine(32)/uridine(32)-2'-O)-methyltransferase TrmJ [Ursidibacter maritimus]MBV6528995.1 tRNA (cyto
MNLLKQIQIVLVETSHSGNIGSTARAMKTMGLSHLRLVSPKQSIDEQAVALSAGAKDVLEQAQIFNRFDDAIADCQLIVGTSARLRHLQSSLIEPRACGELAMQRAKQGKVAIVFGRERVGLTNEELLKCHYHLNVPTNAEYGSLNLAMAVQLVSYEIRMAWLNLTKNMQNDQQNLPLTENTNISYPSAESLAHFFNHTERLYRELGFIRNDAVMLKLRRLYQRCELETAELNLLRGMLTAVEKGLNK